MTVLFVIQHWDSMLIMESINNAEVVFFTIFILFLLFLEGRHFSYFFFILNVIIFVITTL